MATQLHGSHQRTYDAVFQHPISRNLEWRELRAMLTYLCDSAEEEHNGNIKFTRNGQTLSVHPPQHKNFSDVQELMNIRHFLERSEASPPAVVAEGVHLLVVIDHREARIFRTEMHGSVPKRITPIDPESPHWRYLHDVGRDSDGQRKPELKSFYEAVAKTLAGADKILILGSATGSSSAMDYLVTELKQNHPRIAQRVVGTIVVNEQHLTEDQMLAQARAFYAQKSPEGMPKA